MSRVLEGCSYDEHTHAIAGDARGFAELARTIEAASASGEPQSITLNSSEVAGFDREDSRLINVRVKRTADISPIHFSVTGLELHIVGGDKSLLSLGKSLAALGEQDQGSSYSSPRFEPRWFEGDDFLHEDSDDLSFLQLPINPPLRGRM